MIGHKPAMVSDKYMSHRRLFKTFDILFRHYGPQHCGRTSSGPSAISLQKTSCSRAPSSMRATITWPTGYGRRAISTSRRDA
jgi:hypothetical protein